MHPRQRPAQIDGRASPHQNGRLEPQLRRIQRTADDMDLAVKAFDHVLHQLTTEAH